MTKNTPLRWNLETAAREFGHDRKTIRNRCVQAGVTCGPDRKYSTADIIRAVFSDLDAAKLRRAEADAESAEIETARLKSTFVLTVDVNGLWQEWLVTQRAIIERAPYLTDQAKAALLAEFATVEIFHNLR